MAESKPAATNSATKAKAAETPPAEEAVANPRTGPELVPPANDSAAAPISKDDSGPKRHTTFYWADTDAPKMPKVMLSTREVDLCKVNVGDGMPAVTLPKLGSGDTATLSELLGKTATVVVFWKSDRRMAREELADLVPDVIEPFSKQGVTVVGIAVEEPAADATETLNKAGAKFTNLLDADGKAFAKVGSERLPRTYLLDSRGNIVWFDITYSLTTRRELHEALRTITESK